MNVTVSRKETGSALILSLIAILIMAGIGGALFSLAISEQRTTQNASRADAVYYVAEAGIDDAVNKLKAYAATASTEPPYALPDEFAKADFAVIGEILKDADGNTYNEITGEFQSGSYVVTIEPAYAGLGDYKVRSIGTANGEKKGIETRLTADNAGGNSPFGLFGDVFMYAGGNVTTDGYNSTMGTYAEQTKEVVIDGKTYKFANMTGSIGSNGDVQVGEPDGSSSVIVYGNATSGPTSTTTVHPGATVTGTTTPAKTPTPIPSTDYTVPATATVIAGGITGSKNLSGGTYSASQMTSKAGSVINITGDVVIYVSGDVEFHSKSQINIAEGASLKVYQSSSAGKLTINAQAVINTSMDPSTFGLYTNVDTGKLNGGADFYGVIYAPNTNFTINGNSEIYGSATAKQVNITGTANFHYDENLGALPTTVITFDVKSYEQFVVHYSDVAP